LELAVQVPTMLLLFCAALDPQKDSQVDVKMHQQLQRRRQRTFPLVLLAFVLSHGIAAAQGLTGALIGTVKDDQGAFLRVPSFAWARQR